MNFKGWKIRVEFLDHDGYENHGKDFFDRWEAALLSTLKMLVFECNYMPRIGDWIDSDDDTDGCYIGEVSFIASKTIVFWLTEHDLKDYIKQPTN